MPRIHLGLVLILLSTAACAVNSHTDPDVKPDGPIVGNHKNDSVSEEPLWWNCQAANPTQSKPKKSLSQYIKEKEIIFVGKALERNLVLEQPHHLHFNGCWVNFRLESLIKGKLDSNIVLVKFTYDERTPIKDYFSYTNCFFHTGDSYVIFGDYSKAGKLDNHNLTLKYPWREHVLASKDVSEHPKYACPPAERLPEGNKTITEIKNILEK